ncbi:MAG: hypothetical protein ACREBB_06620 [Nitrosotalea sp.]
MPKKYPAFSGKAVKKLADGSEEVFFVTLWKWEPRLQKNEVDE